MNCSEWVAHHLQRQGSFFSDTGEIEHVMYLVETYGELRGREARLTEEELKRARDVSALAYLEDALLYALRSTGVDESRPEWGRPEWYEIAWNTLQSACANALAVIRGAPTPTDCDAPMRARLYTHLLEIHAIQGDLARGELAGVKKSRKEGGEAKTGKATELLKAMYRALYKKLGRPLTARELVAEGKARGWIKERGGDLVLLGRDVQSIIENDLQVIGNRLRSIKRFEGRTNRTA